MTQSLEDLKKKAREEFAPYLTNNLDDFYYRVPHDTMRIVLNTIIEQVYHARTEEVVKIAEGIKKAVLVEDLKMGDIDELEKENYNQALTDLIANITKRTN